MKTNVFFTAILVLGVLFTSCEKEDFNVFPSAKVTTVNFSASNISKLDVSDVFHVYVSFSETEESVQVEANENIHHLIEMTQSGNKLIVGLQKNSRISGAPVLNVYIKTAFLSELTAEGAAWVEFENQLGTNLLEVEITGASTVSGNIDVDQLVADLTGAAKLNITGVSNSFEIDAEGASEMTGFDFATNLLDANLSGGSDISLVVKQKLNVYASGASNIYYKGSGVIENQNLKDASQIIKLD